MAEVPFIDLPEEDHDGVVEEIVALESFPCWSHIYGSDSDPLSPRGRHRHCHSGDDGEPSDRVPGSGPRDRKNQVTFVMDLFHERVEQSHLTGREEFVSGHVNGPNLGVIEENSEMGGNCSRLQLGIGLGFGAETGLDWNSDDDDDGDDCNCGGSVVSDCGDDFFVARRESGDGNPGSSLGVGGVRIVEINSDSDSDLEEGNCLLGIDLPSEGEDYAVDNVDDEDISIPLYWDSFQLEDHGESNNDFEWEEVDDGVDEREVLSFVADPDEEGSISILPISGFEEGGNVERGRGLGNLEWEVLMNVDNLGRSPELESDPGPYFSDHDDHSYTAEYELMFGPLADGENPLLARPPASKSIVNKLPSVVITREDVLNEKALCAVCKDQIEVNEEVKQLPCSHWYHGDCILPWLGIRNTCPVCRYELPTDDPDYELRRTRRAARLL